MGSIVNPSGGGGGDVTAAANLTDNALVLGDGGAKGIKDLTDGLGTSGEVLTSNGAGVEPTWAAVAGGFADWKTIGSSGDFADIDAAITGGAKFCILLENITEGTDIPVPTGGFTIHLNDFHLIMAANQFTFAAAAELTILGFGPNSEIDYTQTSANEELIDTAANTTSVITLKNFKYDNNSAVAGTYIVKSDCESHLSDMYLEVPNIVTSGGHTMNNARSSAYGMYFDSPGATTTLAMVITEGRAGNLSFQGVWNANTANLTIGADAVVQGMYAFDNFIIDLAGGMLSGVQNASAPVDIDITADDSVISDCHLFGGDLDFSTNVDSCVVSNVICADIDMATGNDNNGFTNVTSQNSVSVIGSRNRFSSCMFASNLIITGENTMFSSCFMDGTTTIQATAHHTIMTGCSADGSITMSADFCSINGNRVGAQAGGGANTITVSSGNDNLLIGNHVDAAISDSGTNTVATSNITY